MKTLLTKGEIMIQHKTISNKTILKGGAYDLS